MRRKQGLKQQSSTRRSRRIARKPKTPLKMEMVDIDLEPSKSSLICHLCLCKSEQALPLFEESSKTLLENIRTIFQIEPIRDESISDKICTHCIEKIDEFIIFRQMVIDNHQKHQLEVEEANKLPIIEPYVKMEESEDEDRVWEDDFEPDSEPEVTSNVKNEAAVVESMHEKDEPEPYETDDVDNLLLKEYFAFDCPKCAQKFSSFQELRHHAFTKHKLRGISITCSLPGCNKSFNRIINLLPHLRSHGIVSASSAKYQCDTCEKFFWTKGSIYSHVKRNSCEKGTSDFASRTTYQCDLCSALYYQKFNLKRHFRINHGVQRPGKTRSHQCSQCPKSYLSERSLTNHIRIIHEKAEEVICDACAKVCCNKQSLRIHYKIVHANQPKVACPACGKQMNSRQALSVHLRAHQQQPVACEICSKVMRNRFALQSHYRRVHDTRRHVCSKCGRAFCDKTLLTQHLTIHGIGSALFQCKWCDMSFNFSSTRSVHMKNHHPEEWVQYIANREVERRGPFAKNLSNK